MFLKPQRFRNFFRNRSPASESSVPVNHQKTRDIGKTAIQVVKESLKVVVLFSDTFPPLKSTAAGLVDILDRIDTAKDVQNESKQLHVHIKKLKIMLEAAQSGSNFELKDRLDGLHRALEEQRVALENKVDRSLVTRIIFSTEDSKFLAQVLREITFSIEVTTFAMVLDSNLKISKMSSDIVTIKDNTVLYNLGRVVVAEINHADRPG